MKTIITTGLLCAVIGAATGWMNTADYYEAKARKLLEDTEKAEKTRAEKSQAEVDNLYEKYKEALSVEPVTVERVVTKRLYIKADCDVQADQAGQVDNGQASGIVRLGAEADRSVRQVIKEAEADYARVKNQLAACLARSGATQ